MANVHLVELPRVQKIVEDIALGAFAVELEINNVADLNVFLEPIGRALKLAELRRIRASRRPCATCWRP